MREKKKTSIRSESGLYDLVTVSFVSFRSGVCHHDDKLLRSEVSEERFAGRDPCTCVEQKTSHVYPTSTDLSGMCAALRRRRIGEKESFQRCFVCFSFKDISDLHCHIAALDFV